MTARYLVGDVREQLAALEPASVDLVVTSPPFLALRSYLPAGHDQKALEIGSEATPAAYLDTLLDVTEACARVLAPHGSLVVELGDTYSGAGGGGGDYGPGGWREGQPRFGRGDLKTVRDRTRWPSDKSLCLIPALFAGSLAYGRNLLRPERETDPWRVRNVVAWCRPNPPVGALGDKYRPGTSYLTVACKARDRWFDLDAVREPFHGVNAERQAEGMRHGPKSMKVEGRNGHGEWSPYGHPAGAPPLDWWEIPTEPYAGAHYATFPEKLCVRPILSMCPERVCTVCGQPSRRIVEASTELRDRHPEFAATVRTHREAKAMTQRDVDALFGHNGMCSHWERAIHGDQSQPAYPTPEQWRTLRDALAITTDAFDELIDGFRRWNDRQYGVDYRAQIQRTRRDGFYTSGGNDGRARSGVNGRSAVADYATLGWSDCGHGAWRRGVVLDPFAGSGTTLAVAEGHGRDSVGIDLDARNRALALERCGLFMVDA